MLLVFCILIVLLSLKILDFNKKFSVYEKNVRIKIDRLMKKSKNGISHYKNLYILTKSFVRRKIPFKLKSEKYNYYIRNKSGYERYFVFLSNTEECPKCKKKYYGILKELIDRYNDKKTGIFTIASYKGEHVSVFYLSEEDVPVFFVKEENIVQEIGTNDFTIILFTDKKLNIIDIYKPICSDEYMRRFIEWVRKKIGV